MLVHFLLNELSSFIECTLSTSPPNRELKLFWSPHLVH
jgi:hypothetical protein